MAVSAAIGLAALGYGIYSSAHAAEQAKKARAAAEAQIAGQPLYAPSAESQQQLADARGRLGSVDPSIYAAYQQAQQQAANQQGYAQRNATSGSQALAIGSSSQAQLNGVLPSLAGQQQQIQAQQQQNYYAALQGMTQQKQLQYESELGKSGNLANMYLGQAAGYSQNQSQGMTLAANGLASLAGNASLNGTTKTTPPATAQPYSPYGNGWHTPQMYNPMYSAYLGG